MATGTTIINVAGKDVLYGFYYFEPSYDEIPAGSGVQRRAVRWPESPANLPLIYRKRPTVNNPNPGPEPDRLGDCVRLRDHGYDLSNTPMTWKQEASNLFQNPEIELISGLNNQAMSLLRQTYIDRYGVEIKIICTGAYIKNFDCFIESITYDAVPEYDIFIAKYYFPSGIPSFDKFGNPVSLAVPRSPDGYYYVTQDGQLCFFDKAIPESNVPVPPPTQYEDPEAPLVGAGQVYSSIFDVTNEIESEILPLWKTNTDFNLPNKYLNSSVTDTYESIDYLLEVYDEDPTGTNCPEIIMRLVYADYLGKGTIDTTGKDSNTMTKAMYSQYINHCEPLKSKFKFGSVEDESVFIIDISRKLWHDKIDSRVFELSLNDIDDQLNAAIGDPGELVIASYAVASLRALTLICNQSQLDNDVIELIDGTLETKHLTGSTDDPIGLLYTKLGIIVLSINKLEGIGFQNIVTKETLWTNETNTRRTYDRSAKQPIRLFKMLLTKDDNEADPSGDLFGFKSRCIKNKYVKYAHIRIHNQHYNYSNNPTYVEDKITGKIINAFQQKNQVYITSIGLYNDKKELLAVAKLSKPIIKNSTEEAIITVKIEQ